MNLLILVVSLCLWRPMRYFTTWCTLIHLLHFACLDLSNNWLHWSHPLSFIAATFVYFGFFLVSNIYGGGAPRDLLPFIANYPLLHSFCIGWNHICPLWSFLTKTSRRLSDLFHVTSEVISLMATCLLDALWRNCWSKECTPRAALV